MMTKFLSIVSSLQLPLLLSVFVVSPARAAYFPAGFYQKYNAPLTTCGNQAQCLKYSVVENETPTVCGSPCEYRVCWNQGVPFENFWSWGWQNTCLRLDHIDFIGDMHGTGHVNQDYGLCVNPSNPFGRGYWDAQCTDPQYMNSMGHYFSDVCQNVAAGHTAHLLVSDGGSCAGTAWTYDYTQMGTYAFCAPSTQDTAGTNWGGQTYFPGNGGIGGGTCSGAAEGSECVWSVTVPTTCSYEEGDACPTRRPNRNHDRLCPNNESLLKYYDNDRNGPPPSKPIHDIRLHNNDTVSFRVMNPFGDLSDIYTVFHEDGGEGDTDCPKQTSVTDCIGDDVYTAQCLDDGAWALVTVFVSGYDHNSRAARHVDRSGGLGTEVYKCCPKSYEPLGRFGPEQTAAFTYLIHCRCPSQQGSAGGRALEITDEVASKLHRGGRGLTAVELEAKFQAGDLFDEELKGLYELA